LGAETARHQAGKAHLDGVDSRSRAPSVAWAVSDALRRADLAHARENSSLLVFILAQTVAQGATMDTRLDSRRLLMRRARRILIMISFLVTGERRPKMPKEKWDLLEFAAEHRAHETSAIEVKFGGTAASLFEHLRLAPSGEIAVHNTTSPFEMSCRRVD
jgi:hypothetical protein